VAPSEGESGNRDTDVIDTRVWLGLLFDHMENQVHFGDNKAGLLLTADSILLAALTTLVSGNGTFLDTLSIPARWGLTATLSFLAIGIILALITILPNRGNLWAPQSAPRSRVNFARIARLKAGEYELLALEPNRAELNRDFARDIHGKAYWAARKFRLLYFAIAATTTAVLIAVSTTVFEVAFRSIN